MACGSQRVDNNALKLQPNEPHKEVHLREHTTRAVSSAHSRSRTFSPFTSERSHTRVKQQTEQRRETHVTSNRFHEPIKERED
eukprot:2275816-Rhodomonas_salina.1